MPQLTLPSNDLITATSSKQSAGTYGGLSWGVAMIRAAIEQNIGFGREGTATINGGTVNPPSVPSSSPPVLYPAWRIDGQSGAPDTCERIDVSALTDRVPFMVGLASASRPITFTHRATESGDGTNDIVLANAADVTLTNEQQWLMLRREGNVTVEMGRFGFDLGSGNPAMTTVNMGNQPVFGARMLSKEITSTSHTVDVNYDGINPLTRDSNGHDLLFDNVEVSTLTLSAGSHLQINDYLTVTQAGDGRIKFVAASGAAIANPYGYDTSGGAGAFVLARVIRTDPSVVWQLTGDLDSVGSDPNSRLVLKQLSSSLVSTVSPHDSEVDAVSLTHSPGSNETWLYLARGFFNADGSATTGSDHAYCRMYFDGVERARDARPRYNHQWQAISMAHCVSYGSSPGPQTIKLSIKNDGGSTNQCRIDKPGIIAIRLEADESFAYESGPITDNDGTFEDVVTLSTGSIPADDYIIIASVEGTTTAVDTYEFRVQVDNATITGSLRDMRRNGGLLARYGYACRHTISAGSHTVKLQLRRTNEDAAVATNATLVLLKASNFAQVDVLEQQSEQGPFSNTGYSSRVSGNVALKQGWDTLLLSSFGIYMSSGGGSDNVATQATRNGSVILRENVHGLKDNAAYCPNGTIIPAILTPQSPTDAFALQTKSSQETLSHNVKGASMIFLALSPS